MNSKPITQQKTNNMQTFDLERFKAGAPAYGKLSKQEYLYLCELPDGKIVAKYQNNLGWHVSSYLLYVMRDDFQMKETELTWEDVCEMWAKMDSRTYSNLRWLEENCEPPKLKKK
jgi:hypothetical protein